LVGDGVLLLLFLPVPVLMPRLVLLLQGVLVACGDAVARLLWLPPPAPCTLRLCLGDYWHDAPCSLLPHPDGLQGFDGIHGDNGKMQLTPEWHAIGHTHGSASSGAKA
jgi:hypothetical protein